MKLKSPLISMDDVRAFKLAGTPIGNWIATARSIREQHGLRQANNWLMNTVPKQFHRTIQTMLLEDKA